MNSSVYVFPFILIKHIISLLYWNSFSTESPSSVPLISLYRLIKNWNNEGFLPDLHVCILRSQVVKSFWEDHYHIKQEFWPFPKLVVPFKFFQYLDTIEFTCGTSTLWHSNLNCWSLCWEENGIHKLLNARCPVGNTRSLGVFQCPNFISNFSLCFLKMYPCFIACYNF